MLVLSLLVACSDGADTPPMDTDTVDPVSAFQEPGDYAVGYQRFDVTYDAPGSDEPRVIPVDVWYPAVEDGSPVATYAVAGLVSLPSTAALDAPQPADGPFPTALYSHGSLGVGLLGYPFGERMASHGWVVLAPDHVGNTVTGILTGEAGGFLENTILRPLDVTAAIDAAEDGFDGALSGLAQTDETYVFGHSFGGYTALASVGLGFDREGTDASCADTPDDDECSWYLQESVQAALDAGLDDPRVDAVTLHAPAVFFDTETTPIPEDTPPVLVMGGVDDRSTPHALTSEPLYAALGRPDDGLIELTRGAHYSFITICEDVDEEILQLLRPGVYQDGCGEAWTPISEIMPPVVTYTFAYGELIARGNESARAVFEAEVLHPDMTLELAAP